MKNSKTENNFSRGVKADMNKILIRHLTGSRANQVDQFPGAENEIVFGREPGVNVKYDEDHDDLVSRRHVKIAIDGGGNCQISDLQSRNGAFLNQQRLFGSARLSHNDVVQLGAGGPEFRFEIDPPPATAKPTRVIGAGTPAAMAMTRESTVGVPAQSPRPIGHATVERMLDANFSKVKKESNKFLWFALAAAGIVLVAGLFFYLRLDRGAEQNAQLVQQQQQLLQQMDQQIKQEPERSTAMRDQITQLSAELKKSEQRSERNLQEISKTLAASGGAQPTPKASPDPAFLQEVKAVLEAIKTNPTQAMKGAGGLISQYPNHWESYFVAGVVLRSQNKLPEAKVAYQQALGMAPDNVKPQLSAAIQQINTQSGMVSR
jgi:pSer/pThr/pTyr-binding forkhead associated (FHA) protein